MIFKFIKSYSSSSDSFEMDLPVTFNIPNKFNSLKDLHVLSSYNQEVCDILTSLGIKTEYRYSFKVTREKVIINLKNIQFDKIKTILIRDQKLKELLG